MRQSNRALTIGVWITALLVGAIALGLFVPPILREISTAVENNRKSHQAIVAQPLRSIFSAELSFESKHQRYATMSELETAGLLYDCDSAVIVSPNTILMKGYYYQTKVARTAYGSDVIVIGAWPKSGAGYGSFYYSLWDSQPVEANSTGAPPEGFGLDRVN